MKQFFGALSILRHNLLGETSLKKGGLGRY